MAQAQQTTMCNHPNKLKLGIEQYEHQVIWLFKEKNTPYRKNFFEQFLLLSF
jgi:hypothetical protein